MTILLALAQAALAMGSIRSELDRQAAKVDEPFTLTFQLPPDCPYADVPMPPSGAFEIVSKDYGQAKRFGLVKVDDGGSGDVPTVQHGIERSAGRIVYVLKAKQPGLLVFKPIRIKCGGTVGETFERRISIAGTAKAPEPEKKAESLDLKPAIQDLGPQIPSEAQVLAKELAALHQSTAPLTDLAYNNLEEKPTDLLSRLRAYYEAWLARLAFMKKVWTLEAFGVSSEAAPFVAGGFFVLLAGFFVARDFWRRLKAKRQAEAKLPDIEVRGPKKS